MATIVTRLRIAGYVLIVLEVGLSSTSDMLESVVMSDVARGGSEDYSLPLRVICFGVRLCLRLSLVFERLLKELRIPG